MKFANLGPRLLVAIVLASTCLALLATSVQLYLDYERDLSEIDHEFRQIEVSYVDSLSHSLWSFDRPQTQVQLEGLVKMRDVHFAELQATTGEHWLAGRPVAGRKLERQYTLRAPDAPHMVIGTITIEVSMAGVYTRLLDRMLVILVTQTAKTFFIALFILFIVSRWVTRHLDAMARHARSLSIDNLSRPLVLARAPRSAPDELDAVVGALNDTSRSLAREIAQRTDVEQRSRAKSAFLAHLSHELRNPLNAILGYAQMLHGDPRLDAQQRRGADTIQASGRHLMTLIDDVLDHARIEAGRLQLSPTDVAFGGLLQDVADITRVQAEQKRLAFVVDLDDELPAHVHVDGRALRQVLLNLLGNAVKFTERGEVWLRVHRLSVDTTEARLGFAVQDSGVGIEPAQIGRLFEPYEQVGPASQRNGGSGLGLAISQQIVRAMGSDILVDSTPGIGSRFSFELVLPVASAG